MHWLKYNILQLYLLIDIMLLFGGFFKPALVKLLNFFGSGIQLYVLLSPYLCFYIMMYMYLEMIHRYVMDLICELNIHAS